METNEVLKITNIIMGFPGRMLCGSKSLPNIVYNANLCTMKHGKIWYGDIHRINDLNKLLEIANTIEEPVFVLYESDARFGKECNLNFKVATIVIEPDVPRY
jgi:hypothetical protein